MLSAVPIASQQHKQNKTKEEEEESVESEKR
jgi:hypothetical protein